SSRWEFAAREISRRSSYDSVFRWLGVMLRTPTLMIANSRTGVNSRCGSAREDCRRRPEVASHPQLALTHRDGSRDAVTTGIMQRFRWQVALALLTCIPVRAQSHPIRLSLAQAIERAVAENPEVQIATPETAPSQHDRIIARSALFPQASLNVDESVRRINVESLIGHQLPLFGQASGPFQATGAGVAFSIPVFDIHLWKQYRAAKDRVAASRADAQTRREEISLLVVSQYLGVLRAMAGADAASSRVSLARALLDQAKALHQTGVATQVDEVRAEVKVRQEEQSLMVAQTDMQTGLFGLARLLNVPPEGEIQVSDRWP